MPALLGLKGNLDMTLASRLSTQANLGNMNSAKEIVHMVVGNISLVQVQATVAAFLVSCFSMGVGSFFNEKPFNMDHALLLTASSMFTATTSCFVLGKPFLQLCGGWKKCLRCNRKARLSRKHQKRRKIPVTTI